MSPTVFNPLMLAALTVLLGGCGLTQTVADSTTSVAKAVFYKQINTLHLDVSSRVAMNTDEVDMNALSVPTLVRVYQLRDSRAIERASYDSLLNNDDSKLNSDLLDMRALLVKPGEGVQLSVPMDKDARFVAVVGLFRQPDIQADTWRLTLTRDDLDPDRARLIELGDNRLTLRTLVKE
ncbi:MAG TPA: type VI secretion system lipoprotein TssJ [Pseudomonas sp.]|uniref:type VI secretion system lipoprotein TssJ n=1 Tax=Pseudomonas sp. TaxID=306 RepID=UPI002ED7C6E5